jgi:hypothetical protein
MTVIVSWKCEDFVDDVAVGPCYVIDVEARDADPNVTPTPFGVSMPFDYKAPWLDDRGWITRSQADAIAREHGVELQES